MKNQFILKSGAIMASLLLSACNEKQMAEPQPENYGRPGAVTSAYGDIRGKYIFEGDARIKGDIIDGAIIIIKNGGLIIDGNVGNNVTIRQSRIGEAPEKEFLNEKDFGLSGIKITGNAGKSFVVTAPESLEVGNVGENLFAEVGGDAKLGDIADYGGIRAGNINAGNIGRATQVRARQDATVGLVAPKAVVTADGVAQVGTASKSAQVGDSRNAAGIARY